MGSQSGEPKPWPAYKSALQYQELGLLSSLGEGGPGFLTLCELIFLSKVSNHSFGFFLIQKHFLFVCPPADFIKMFLCFQIFIIYNLAMAMGGDIRGHL